MKRDDHLALAAYLMSLNPQVWARRGLRTAFYAGSVLPDSNPATYLRGVTRAGRPAGHDRAYSYPLILRLLSGLLRTGVTDARQAYRMGALMHYLADALTYPHTAMFRGGVPDHNRFERALHRAFPEALRRAESRMPPLSDPFRTLAVELAENAPVSVSPAENADKIIALCSAVWRSVFQENAGKSLFSNKKS